jgi:N-acetylglucosamine kinase-like BadF-type ATPase
MSTDNQNILVADSGSTKTDWALGSRRFSTQGINPVHQSDEQIAAILDNELLPQLSRLKQLPYADDDTGLVGAVVFYGSGVRSDQEERMVRLLHQTFMNVPIEAHSDLLGAARALCGDEEGLACILGTGANSCLYDGCRIVKNTPPMGYVLGDEGSGAVLGLRFLNALYKGRLDMQLRKEFEETIKTDLTSVIDQVYRKPLPNRWLASLSPFIHDHLHHEGVEQLVVENFLDFIHYNIDPYRRSDLPLQAVGSIAFFYKPQLCFAAKRAGYEVGKILRSPLDGLLLK